MKKLSVFIVVIVLSVTQSFGYNTKDYTSLSKYNSKYEFVDFNKYLKTVTHKREKYYRITEFVDFLLSYDQIHTKFEFENIDEMMRYNYEESVRLRKGVCSDYANIYANICRQNHLECNIIGGYTKQLNEQKQTIIGSHAWIIADSIIIDPTFCDSYAFKSGIYNGVNHSESYEFVDSMYFDIDPTIATYTYFPCTDASMLMLETKYNMSYDIPTNMLVKDKFWCVLDISKPILTKIRVDFEWFLTTPYITHKYDLYETIHERKVTYINDTVIKLCLFKHIETRKITQDTVVCKKYELENLQPYKTVNKTNPYYELGTRHIKEQIYISHRKDYVFK